MSQEAPLFSLVPEADFTPEELQQRASLMAILGDKRLFPKLKEPYGYQSGLVLPEQIKCTPIRIGQGVPNIWIACLQGTQWAISSLSTRDRLIVNVPHDEYHKALGIQDLYVGMTNSYGSVCRKGLDVNGYDKVDPTEYVNYGGLSVEAIQDSDVLPYLKSRSTPIDYKAVFLGFVAIINTVLTVPSDRINAITVCNPSTPPVVPA